MGLQTCKVNIMDFSSWLSKESPGQIHVWCYAHVLNLVLGDTTKAVIQKCFII
jgi:hypothetical protein